MMHRPMVYRDDPRKPIRYCHKCYILSASITVPLKQPVRTWDTRQLFAVVRICRFANLTLVIEQTRELEYRVAAAALAG
jgi:hypothetical protein